MEMSRKERLQRLQEMSPKERLWRLEELQSGKRSMQPRESARGNEMEVSEGQGTESMEVGAAGKRQGHEMEVTESQGSPPFLDEVKPLEGRRLEIRERGVRIATGGPWNSKRREAVCKKGEVVRLFRLKEAEMVAEAWESDRQELQRQQTIVNNYRYGGGWNKGKGFKLKGHHRRHKRLQFILENRCESIRAQREAYHRISRDQTLLVKRKIDVVSVIF